MTIIMGLYERDNVVKPSTDIEHKEVWSYCIKNVRWPNETFDYKLFELWIFGCYESNFDSSSNIDHFSPIMSQKNQDH